MMIHGFGKDMYMLNLKGMMKLLSILIIALKSTNKMTRRGIIKDMYWKKWVK